ncbi:chromatin complexes subunit BAP18 [Nephila pilipes]|uniref:Chromatin complexes subunit BAP18 n=1 Tax=Nephila pilipes TaxID=299642 RepID=A0A8X6N1N1_NEPPI|nr:chromatin complexes subunit BAP18 [Nephila pilipes]
MSYSNRVEMGEIFTAAGAAFNKLAELIMNIHSINELPASSNQIKTPVIQKKEEPLTSIGMKKSSCGIMKTASEENKIAFNIAMAQSTPKPYITLNMLNATEHDQEIDVASVANTLDYDSTDAA